MNEGFIQFGDIFRHNEREYVFLSQSEVVYAALILGESVTERVIKAYERLDKLKSPQKNNAAYVIVVLDTNEFKGRGAHFARTDNTDHQTTTFDKIGKLNKEDCLKIKEEIVSEKSVVPIKLIEIVKALNVG